jgi:DNA-binding NarL/FixJ family response regulator
LAEGLDTRDLAQRLVISPNTARNHIQHILQKLQVHSRTEAVATTIRHGFIS